MVAFIVGLVAYLTIGAFGCELKGVSHPRIGIMNGEPGKITNFPFMARYGYANTTRDYLQLFCGAAIISERYLVTTAECAFMRFQVDNEDKRVVTVGTDKVEDGEDYEIEKTILHPYFLIKLSSEKMDYDIAVIKLKKNLTFSERVRPIELAKEDLELKSGAVLTALGYGSSEPSNDPSPLKKISLAYMDYNTCRNTYKKYNRHLSHRMLCAGSSKRGSCIGDGGSPIIYNGTLLGVTSGTNPFCYSKCVNLMGLLPGVYSSIPKLRSFIEDTMKYE